MAVRRPRQLALPMPNTWGGWRRGAGAKRRGPRPCVAHRTRPYHDRAHPAHVTLRAVAGLASFRLPHTFAALRDGVARAQKPRFRICHFSVQSNHVHMLVEAESRQALIRGMQGLAIRLARAINRVLARRGSVWADRYHRHDLATPREVRNAIVYVLNDVKKHQPGFAGLDPCSTARWFPGWHDHRPPVPPDKDPPVTPPGTWLLRVGWRRAGPVRVGDVPVPG